jgi:hypothetical protein
MSLDALWRVLPCDKLAPRRRRREDLEFLRTREPLILEVPDDRMRRRRERLQERALAFDAHDATPLRNERPEKLQVPVVRPKALFGPLKPNQVSIHATL